MSARWDSRYQYVTCPRCKRKWQVIDYACALHRLSCGPAVDQIPEAEQTRLIADGAAHGVTLRFEGGGR